MAATWWIGCHPAMERRRQVPACHREESENRSCAGHTRERISVTVYTLPCKTVQNAHALTSLQSACVSGAGAAVRAADASLRDGGHAEAASQGREHQNSL